MYFNMTSLPQQYSTIPTISHHQTSNDSTQYSHDGQTTSPLMSLSLEVLLHITSYLPTPDYCNFRITSKYFEEQLYNAFAKEFFTKRQFMITSFSLQALIDISKSRFSSTLTHVIFGLERPHSYTDVVSTSWAQNDPRNRMAFGVADHRTLVYSGHHVEMLVEAFSNLPNLETIGMRDFNSRTRFRDTPHNLWNSYGYNTWVRETSARPQLPQAHTPDCRRVLHELFLSLLRALGDSKSKSRSFEFILRTLKFHDQVFYIPPYLSKSISEVLKNVRTIFIDLDAELSSVSSSLGNDVLCVNYHLRNFLAKTPNLEHLRLNFAQLYSLSTAHFFLDWFAESPNTVPQPAGSGTVRSLDPPPPVHFPELRQLDIGLVTIKPTTLLAIIQKYQSSLTTLSFHKVCLQHPDENPTRGKVNLWAKFFRSLSAIDVKLTTINMTSLQQLWGHNRWREVKFGDSKIPYIRRWAGTNMQSALRDFADHVKIEWQDNDSDSNSPAESVSSYNSDDEEDSEADDDE